MRKKILFIFGTRPGAIKLIPLIKKFKESGLFDVKSCAVAQHRQMLDHVIDFFSVIPDYDLNLMKKDQTLFDITANSLKRLEEVLGDVRPDLIFLQGDTTTAFAASLAAFYKHIRIAHIEAGLRSFDKYSPFPEEMNRILTSSLASYHFCPTEKAAMNLSREGIDKNIFVVGNTVIDALFLGLGIIKKQGEDIYKKYFSFLDFSKRIILLTCHRRESFGEPVNRIFRAILRIADDNRDVEIVYPVHPNPNIKNLAHKVLSGKANIHLTEPLAYPYLIWLMSRSYLILTDSGGIQEEAPSLGKPVLVLREVTERTEGIEAGTAALVGTDEKKIIKKVLQLLTDRAEYEKMAKMTSPYGDGKSSERILDIIKKEL